MTVRRFAHFPDPDLAILSEVLARATHALAPILFAEALAEIRLRQYRGATAALPADIERMLDTFERSIMSDPNLDAIANDWPALRDAITSRISGDATTIATLTAELASAASSTTPISDARAAEIDSEMKAALASLTGTAQAVATASGPTSSVGATGATGATASTGATGATAAPPSGAQGATGTTGATAASTTGGATGTSGSAASPGAPPPGSAAG